MLIVPVVFGGRTLGVLEVYRALPHGVHQRARSTARACVAQQFGAALDRLSA